MEFRPTRPPPGRLVRLGVVLDTRNEWGRLAEIARMCDGAGIDALWVRDQLAPGEGKSRLEAWTALTLCSREAIHPRLGAVLTVSLRSPALLAAMARTLDSVIGGRLELGLSTGRIERDHLGDGLDVPESDAQSLTMERYAEIIRGEISVPSAQPGGPTLSIEATTERHMESAARIADDLLLPASAAHDVRALSERIQAACERADRSPSTLGVGLDIPVSIGRTVAEAQARADAEGLFKLTGRPQDVGVFGTLEQCQERVIQLAHAGVTDLRCVIPNSPDVHDVLAQLTAIAIGTSDVLAPGTPRSKAPDPPTSWGGRSSRP